MGGKGNSLRIAPPEFVSFALHRLEAKGHECYIVGGAIRDSLLGRKHQDWDIATSASTFEIKQIFYDTRHYQLKHDTITIVRGGRKVEITPFRGIGGMPGLKQDLARRDFTINAMAYSPSKGRLIDPFGGREDLSRKLIRAVGDPAERFQEDPIRLLRAIRLAVELGFDIVSTTQRVISQMSHLINTIAVERIREELRRILMAKRPSRGFLLMRSTGLLGLIIPELLEGA